MYFAIIGVRGILYDEDNFGISVFPDMPRPFFFDDTIIRWSFTSTEEYAKQSVLCLTDPVPLQSKEPPKSSQTLNSQGVSHEQPNSEPSEHGASKEQPNLASGLWREHSKSSHKHLQQPYLNDPGLKYSGLLLIRTSLGLGKVSWLVRWPNILVGKHFLLLKLFFKVAWKQGQRGHILGVQNHKK